MNSNSYDSSLVFNPNWRIAIVASRFNQEITNNMVQGAQKSIFELKFNPDILQNWLESSLDIFRVPGAIEIPLIVQECLKSEKYDAVVALGCVIQGDTPHFDYVCKYVTEGLLKLNLDYSKPIAYGVITTNTLDQAVARSSENESNKGREAMLAAIETLNTVNNVRFRNR